MCGFVFLLQASVSGLASDPFFEFRFRLPVWVPVQLPACEFPFGFWLPAPVSCPASGSVLQLLVRVVTTSFRRPVQLLASGLRLLLRFPLQLPASVCHFRRPAFGLASGPASGLASNIPTEQSPFSPPGPQALSRHSRANDATHGYLRCSFSRFFHFFFVLYFFSIFWGQREPVYYTGSRLAVRRWRTPTSILYMLCGCCSVGSFISLAFLFRFKHLQEELKRKT